jgi:hypothetical protein
MEAFTVTVPFGDITECRTPLTENQLKRLLTGASLVDWDALDSSYRPTDNPTCCCDQISSTLSATIDLTEGDELSVSTEWCSTSITSGTMPSPFLSFLDLLSDIADEVFAACEG